MGETLSLFVTVPICSFRKGYAREYLETETLPPPSTIYGFLLSLVGEEDRYRYTDTRLAYAALRPAELSTILRTAWRVKTGKLPLGTGQNKRPDYQEILTGLEIGIWVQTGNLAQRLQQAAEHPEQIQRYGGLCLGESHDLVNDVCWSPDWAGRQGEWVTNDPQGDLPLPIWVDHVGSKDTVWGQYRLVAGTLSDPPVDTHDQRWITIVAPSR